MASTLTQKSNRLLTGDTLLKGAATTASVGVLLMLTALIVVLVISAWPAIKEFGFHFLIGTEWRPNELPGDALRDAAGHIQHDEEGEILRGAAKPPVFGALPVIWGTVVSSIIALVVAIPISFGAALVLVRMTWQKLSAPISFLIEFLAAIPSIAYGLWGLFIFAPFLQDYVEPRMAQLFVSLKLDFLIHYTGSNGEVAEFSKTGRDMLCGGLILAIMILPIITAISRDVLRAVPRAQVEGAQALGANWWQSSKEMLKYSKSALFGAVMLGLARAAGETMAIAMVIGNNNQIRFSPFAPAQTMSSLLANEFSEASDSMHRAALMEVALVLLVMSLIFNIVARRLVVGKK